MATNKMSSHVEEEWPYLLPKIQKVAGVGGNGNGSGAAKTPYLATLGDVTLTTPSDGQVLTYDSISGRWVNETPAGGGGGGSSYTAGLGIDISGTTISTKQQASGGITVDALGLFIKRPANSGLGLDATGLYVGAGYGITVLGNTVAVDVAAIVDPTRGIDVNSNKIVAKIDPTGGLEIAASGGIGMASPDDLDVSTTNATSATGHTHNIISETDVSGGLTALLHAASGDLKLKTLELFGDLGFLGGNRAISASNSLTLQPANNLRLDPGGVVAYPDSQESRSDTFTDSITGIKGWRIWDNAFPANTMQLTINALKSDNLYARKFTVDEWRVARGAEAWSKSFGIVETTPAVGLPAAGSTIDVWFEEAPDLGNFPLFEANDWLQFRTIDVATGLLIQTIWCQVVSMSANGYIVREAQTADGVEPPHVARQQWRIQRKSGGFAGMFLHKGDTAVDFGQPNVGATIGQGAIALSALKEDGGPWLQMETFERVVSNVPEFKNRVRMGNLDGTVNFSGPAWGFAAGNDLSRLPDALTNPFSGVTVDAVGGAQLYNTDLTLHGAGGIPTVVVDRTHGMSLRFDSAVGDDPLRMLTWFDDLDVAPDLEAGAGYLLAAHYNDGTQTVREINLGVNGPYGTGEKALVEIWAGPQRDEPAAVLTLTNKQRLSTAAQGEVISLSADEVFLSKTLIGHPDFDFGHYTDVPKLLVWDYDRNDGHDTDRYTGMTIEHQLSPASSGIPWGDAVLHWRVKRQDGTNDRFYSMGIDASDGQKWKLSAAERLGAPYDILIFDPATGTVTINGLDVGGSTPPTGLSAGFGIDLIGSTISVDADVARAATLIATGNGLSGGGSLSADRTINLVLPTPSGLQVTAGGLAIADSLAGTGLTMSGKVLSVNPAALVPATRTIDVTTPLSGGGPLTADVTIGLTYNGVDSGLTVIAGSLAVDGSVLRATTALNTTLPLIGGGPLGAGLNLGLRLATTDPALQVTDGLAVLLNPTNPALNLTGGLNVLLNATDPALSKVGGLNILLNPTDPALSKAGGLGVLLNATSPGLTKAAGLAILLPANSGLSKDSSGLYLSSTLAGAGLALDGSRVLSVNAAKGVRIGTGADADNVIVDLAYGFAWTGAHSFAGNVTLSAPGVFALGQATTVNANVTFNSGVFTFNTNPKVNANLDFTGTERNITSASGTNLNLVPDGNLVLNPGGSVYKDVLPGGSAKTDLGQFNRKWAALYAAELYVETLVASSVMGTIGGRVMVTPTSVLVNDFVSTDSNIDLKHNSMVANSFLYLETINATTLLPQVEAIRLGSAAPTTITGGFRYPVVSRGLNGGGAKNWAVGDAVVTLGAAVNDGYIDLASVQTIHSKVGPTVTIYNRTGTSLWNSVAPVVSMGNLNGFAGLGNVYGFAAGNDLTLSGATGFSGFVATAPYSSDPGGLKMYNTDIKLYQSGNQVIELSRSLGLAFSLGDAGSTYDDGWITWQANMAAPTLSAPPAMLGHYQTSPTGTIYGWWRTGGPAISRLSEIKIEAYSTGNTGSLVALQPNLAMIGLPNAPLLSLKPAGILALAPGGTFTASTSILNTDENNAFTNNQAGITVRQEGAGDARLGFWRTSQDWAIGIDASNANAFSIAPAQDLGSPLGMTILTGGNVGIGPNASSPTSLLHVWNNQDAATIATVQNSTVSANAQSIIRAATASWNIALGKTSASTAQQGIIAPNDGFILNSGGGAGGDIAIRNANTAGAIKMAVGGGTVSQFYLDSSGRVGIGTEAPGFPLDVQGSVDGDVRLRVGNTYSNAASNDDTVSLDLSFWWGGLAALSPAATIQAYKTDTWIAGSTVDSGLRIFTRLNSNTIEHLTLAPGGNIGMVNGSPGTLLDIGAGSAPTINPNPGTGIWVRPGTSAAGINFVASGGGQAGMMVSTAVFLGAWSNHALNLRTNNVDRMTFDTSGNAGIGNGSPGTLLDIGAGAAPTINPNPGTGIWIRPGTAAAGVNLVTNGGQQAGMVMSTSLFLGAWSNHPMVLRTNNTDRITIAAGGGVTIPGLLTASGGISFGGTTLANYDEGTWVPTLLVSGVTTGIVKTSSGYYTRAGNVVTAWGQIILTNKGSNTGQVAISSLPVTPSTNQNSKFLQAIGFYNCATACIGMYAGIASGGIFNLYFSGSASGGVQGAMSGSNLTNTSQFDFVLTYFV